MSLSAWKFVRQARGPLSSRLFTALTLSALLACSDSTEAVDQTFVTIQSASTVVLRGKQLELTARVWIRTAPGDSAEIPNAELMWSTDDPTLASLTSKDNHTAIATGVNSGTVPIHAVATGFQGSAQAVFPLRVSDPIEIDSVRPLTVRYGEKLTLYGVGVNTLFLAMLKNVPVFPDTFSVSLGAGGLGQFSFWVPPPATSGHAVVLSPEKIVVAGDSTTVLPQDLYEPNETAPSPIDISGTPFPAVPSVRYYNPALAFEPRNRADSMGIDWYRMTGATAGEDLTFVFQAPTAKSAHLTFLSAPVNSSDSVTTPAWTIGSSLYYCKTHPFRVEEEPAESLIVALKNVMPGDVDLISLFFVTGRYGLAVAQGYLTSDPAIGPDRLEENDNCEYADRNYGDPQKRIDLPGAFSDTLTIDNPHDVDWIRFSVTGSNPQIVTFRTAPRLTTGSRSGDIDLYVIHMPVAGSPIDTVGTSRADGSDETLTRTLSPGDYYMVITDFAGTPVKYAVCADIGLSCNFPPGSMVTRVPSQSRARVRSGAAR